MTGAHLQLLATEVLLGQAGPTPNTGGEGPEFGKAAPIGLVVVLLLVVATALLVRSMNRHLRGMPTSFDTDDDAPAPLGEETPPRR